MILVTLRFLTHPLSTKLSASVPPEVKIISEAETFNIWATSFLAVSIKALEDLPKSWVEDGFPNSVCNTWVIVLITSDRTCVVAALSKYTFFNSKILKGYKVNLKQKYRYFFNE